MSESSSSSNVTSERITVAKGRHRYEAPSEMRTVSTGQQSAEETGAPDEFPIVPSAQKEKVIKLIWFTECSILLSLIMPSLLLLSVHDRNRSDAWVLTLAVMVWSGFRMSAFLATGRSRVFQFIFWMFVYIFLGLAPTVQIRLNEISSTTKDMPSAIDWLTATIIVVSLICFELGSFAAYVATQKKNRTLHPASTVTPFNYDLGKKPEKRGISARSPRENARVANTSVVVHDVSTVVPIGRQPSAKYTNPRNSNPIGINPIIVWLLLFFGLICMSFYVNSIGLHSLFENREARTEARGSSFSNSSFAAIIASLAWVPALISVGGFSLLRSHRIKRDLRGGYILPITIGVASVLLVVNPISGARYTVGTVFFALLAFTGVLKNPKTIRWVLFSLLAALLFLFPIADAFRRSEASVERSGFFDEYAGNGDYDAFWQIANSLLLIEHQGFEWGQQAIGVIFFWVPRSMWPNKPEDTGIFLAEFRGYDFTNLSAPLWAEALVNGGWIALIIVFICLGVVLYRLDLKIPSSIQDGGTLAIATSVFPAYMLILLRGSLLQASGIFVVMLISIVSIGFTKKYESSSIGRDP